MSVPRHLRIRVAAACLAAALLFAPQVRAGAQALRALGGVDQLKSWFNAHRAHPRLVLLLSPT